MLVEALWRGQDQEANFAVHGDTSGLRLLPLAQLKEVRSNKEPAVLRFPHGHLHLALGRLAVAGLMPAGLGLPDMTAVLKLTVLGERTHLAINVLFTTLR